MTRKSANKESAPRAINGFNTEAMRLPSNGDVKAERADRRHVERARRLDVFALFLSRDAIPLADYDAVRRLEADIHLAAGVANVGESNRTGGGGSAERVTQRMIDASRRVYGSPQREGVMQLINEPRLPRAAGILLALLSPDGQGAVLTRWRPTVVRFTGKTDNAAQADVIRWASAAVREAYASLDYEQRRCA